jgi:hypothetical protein
MDKKQAVDIGMNSAATYQIVLIGRLDQAWEDWFDNTQVQLERHRSGRPMTTLNCRVRDQSELLGILNRLNSLNFPLLSVRFLGEEG